MSRIDLHLEGTANFVQIDRAIARLKTQLASLNSMNFTGVISSNAQNQLNQYLQTFRETIDASGMYQRQTVSITNETEKFGRSLERGNLRLGQLYRAAMDYRRSEVGQIRQLAKEQIRLQNSIALTTGNGIAEVFTPRGIDEGIEKHRILSEEYRILRQVIRNGSTELINWGKNTQWAGRQLTVGLTVPITLFGAAASKAFMDADKQLTRLSKVYGDATKGMANSGELEKIRSQTMGLAQDIASSMGVSVTETLGIAADIAATGKEGNELLGATREAMRLSVLGEVDRQEAMRATLAIQTVFKQSTEGLTESINFLNAVENQTSTSLNDLVVGIVKAGPVVQGLGGSIEDLSLMMVAMREGGVPASEAANAIKSSLGALINPTKQTTQVLSDFGINIKEIVDQNAGDVIGTLSDLQTALSGLDDLSRQRAIEQIFGKFQFSRINALLNNLNKAGSQTEQVMAIAGMSTSQLAKTAEQELSAVTESVSGKFLRAVETLKANLIPIGQTFTEVGTILLNVGSKILEIFNSLPEPIQNFFKYLTLGTAVIGPLIMITGVLGNFFGYLIKGMSTLMLFKKEGREAFRLITPESVAAERATELLTESLFNQTTAIDTMASAIDKLLAKLENLQKSLLDTANSSTVANSEVLSRVEAGAASLYNTPQIEIQRVNSEARGFKDAKVQYSHMLGQAAMASVKGLGARGEATLGLGTFVQGRVAELQGRLKDMVIDLLAIPSEIFATPEARRAELTRLAESLHTVNSDELAKTMDIINSLTDSELAQILPSWEKISKQTSLYSGTLSAAAKAVESGSADARQALETFKQDVIDFGPEVAFKNLKSTLESAGIVVEDEIKEIESIFDRILAEAENVAPGEARAKFLFKRLTNPEEGVVRNETNAQRILEEQGVAGYSKKSGFNRVLMLAAQSLTDEYFNEAALSKELQAAYRRALAARLNLETAAEEEAKALENKKTADSNLVSAEENAQKQLDLSYTTKKDLSTARKTDDGRWEIDGQVVGKRQTALIKALDEREAAIQAAAEADLRYVAASEKTIDAQDRNRQSEEMLAMEQQAEAQRLGSDTSSEELVLAEQELEAATQKAAAAREKLAAAEQETAALGEKNSANNQRVLQLLNRKKEIEAMSLEERRAADQEYTAITEEVSQTYAEMLGFNEELKKSQEKEKSAKDELTAAEEELTAALQKAEAAQKQNTQSTKENTNAEKRDTLETTNSATAEKIDSDASRRLAAAESADAAATSSGINTEGKRSGRLSGLAAGVGTALSMATMLIPTGDNEALNTASNILGAAGMGASMGGMAGPWGALAGAVIGAAIPAVTSYVDAQQKANDALIQYSQSLSGAAGVIEGFGADLERRSPTEKLNEAIIGLKIPEEFKQTAQSILESETGQKLVSGARAMSGEQRTTALLNQLKQLTLSEIFTPEEAKAVARELALELGDPKLGKTLVEGIVSIIDSEGNLISDALSQQFIDTLPTVQQILKRGASISPPLPTPPASPQDPYGRGEMGVLPEDYQRVSVDAYRIRAEETDRIKANMSLMAGDLKQIAEAQALVKLSFQQGEITLDQYNLQMDQLSTVSSTVYSELKKLIEMDKADFIGAASILGDIASAQGVTEQFDKVVDRATQLQEILQTGYMFRVPLEAAAAYGQLQEDELKNFQDILTANPEIQATVTTIFDQSGSDEFSLDIIRMINSGMDATKLQLILETQGLPEGINLINNYHTILSSLPPESYIRLNSEVNYDPAKMNEFLSDYEFAMGLPDTKKELRAEVSNIPELKIFADRWKDISNLSEIEIKRSIFEYLVTLQWNVPPPPPMPVADPINWGAQYQAPSMDASSMAQSTYSDSSGGSGGSSGGSGGGSSDNEEATKEIEKRYNRQIKAQQKLIDEINKERDARQRVLDIQKEAQDFALRQANLESEIARAKAEGNFAKAALLQGQLDAEKEQKAAEDAERRRQAEEDRKIEQAEKEIKRLEKQKAKELEKLQKAQSASSGGSGGGGGTGGSGGGLTPEQQAELETKIQFINDKLIGAIEKIGVDQWAKRISENGASAFWDSTAVKNYKQALLELGVPMDIINQSLETMFDSIINQGVAEEELNSIKKSLTNIGISGETAAKIVPNLFAILNDPKLNKAEAIKQITKQFIESGAGAKEAERLAKKFFNTRPEGELFRAATLLRNEFKGELSPKNAEIITAEFIKGLKGGLTASELEEIKQKIVETFLPKDLGQRSLEAQDAAIAAAEAQAQAVIDAALGVINDPNNKLEVEIETTTTTYVPGDRGYYPAKDTGQGNDPLADTLPNAADGTAAAQDVATGYQNGIAEIDWQQMKELYYNRMVDPAHKALQTGSPSLAFEEIGIFAMQGFIGGITTFDALNPIKAKFDAILASISDMFVKSSISAPHISPTGTGAGAVWADNFNSIVVQVLGNGTIPNKFSEVMTLALNNFISLINGPIGIDTTLSSAAEIAGTNLFTILTEKMQETVDEINNILKESLKTYSFDIVGVPKIYVAPGTEDTWKNIIPNFAAFPTTDVPPVEKAEGGYISGPGGPTDDLIPAWLSDGEYVIRAKSVDKYGTGLLDNINAGKFADGGEVVDFTKTKATPRRPPPGSGGFEPTPGELAASYATRQFGKPYSMAAQPPKSWDCAKLTSWSWAVATGADPKKGYNDKNAKLRLPSYSHDQARFIKKRVIGNGGKISGLSIGDILYFAPNGIGVQPGHTSIYVGDDTIFEASSPEIGLRYQPLNNSWNQQYLEWAGPPRGYRDGGLAKVIPKFDNGGLNTLNNSGLTSSVFSNLDEMWNYWTKNYQLTPAADRPWIMIGGHKIALDSLMTGLRWSGAVTSTGSGPDDFEVDTSVLASNRKGYLKQWYDYLTGKTGKKGRRPEWGGVFPGFDDGGIANLDEMWEHWTKNYQLIPAADRPWIMVGRHKISLDSLMTGLRWSGAVSSTGSGPDDFEVDTSVLANNRKGYLKQWYDYLTGKTGGKGRRPEWGGVFPGFDDGGLVRLNPEDMSILGEKMATWMNQFDGVPYNSGGAWADGPENGWGCATAARWLYQEFAGINIGDDSLSANQYSSSVGKQVSNTLPGDQQFFYYANGVNVDNPINHTGVAQSASTMYHASGGTYGSYANASIDTAARSIAASRAGGTAQKRYLPETIGGMGMPTGYLKNGGMVFGEGGPTDDSILAMLSNGEYVMSAYSVQKYGKDFMEAVNNGTLAEAAAGGLMSKYPSYVSNMSSGGMVPSSYANGGKVSDSISNVEYNINVNVAGSNASPEEIAQTVMTHLKRKERMTGAVTRV